MTNKIIYGHGGGCFRKGTKVLKDKGIEVNIEDINLGDEVLSFDQYGNVHVSIVEQTHLHIEPQPILEVKFWNGVVYITPNHWVLNQYGSFVEIGTLTIEDALVDKLGHLRPILSTSIVAYEPVYNLTVSDNHTFIANSIRVHNGGHRSNEPLIYGSGGGGKGGGGRAAKEDPNTLKATQFAEVIDLISEGEIVGLVDGSKSIYLDGIPITAADGSANFSGYTYEVRNGTQDQEPVTSAKSGTVSTMQNPNANTKIIKGADSKLNAQEVVITDPRVTRVDVTVGTPMITYQDPKNGDLKGSSVEFNINIRTEHSGWMLYKSVKIEGKCTSVYQESHEVYINTTDFPIYIQVERTSDDPVNINTSNQLYWYSYSMHMP